jgi:hypothetical protein
MLIDEILAEFRLHYDLAPALEESAKRWSREGGRTEPEMLNDVAVGLAFGFSVKELDFGFCSTFMRRLKDYSFGREWPPLFWEIFIAFDAGEFYHDTHEPRDIEPSELHTRPMIEIILRRLRQLQPPNG